MKISFLKHPKAAESDQVGWLAPTLILALPEPKRLAMASTAAGHAYTAAIDTDACDALLVEMEREIPEKAKLLRSSIDRNRHLLRKQGYIVACGLWSPNINGIAAPVWSPRYQTFVVTTIGLSSAAYDEGRLHEEVAPRLLKLSGSIRGILEAS